MEPTRIQLSLAAMLGVVAFAALNIWLFRVSVLAGLIGLNVSKHLLIAYLCQILGVDRRTRPAAARALPPGGPSPSPASGRPT